jgi:hypothetical protein
MQPLCLRSLVAILGLAVAAAPLAASGDGSAGQRSSPPASGAAAAAKPPAGTRCETAPSCHTDCSNTPFEPTDCWTTAYGPAKADVIVSEGKAGGLHSTNMLYCPTAMYALCFFSGPPTPTGKNCGDGSGTNCTNQALPCVVDGKIAKCTCKAYTSPYFVDINGILNLGVYYQTVHACGVDGKRCQNIVKCGPNGNLPGCASLKQAPVCDYVKNQNPAAPSGSLWPKADLISTFGFAMDANYRLGSTPCAPGPYAGCMTAPCTFGAASGSQHADGDPIQCECPIYNGPYQVGQNSQSCTIPGGGGQSYVWSASYTVEVSPVIAKPPKQ